MTKLTTTVLFLCIAILVLNNPTPAQRACADQGPDCRLLTSAEVEALKARFLALKAVLPVPDPARYPLAKDVDEAYTMPFIAETNIGGGPMCGCSWRAGCFIEKNSVDFPYDLKPELKKPVVKPKADKEPKDTEKALKEALAWVESMQADVGTRIEVHAQLLPHPFLVSEVNGKCADVSDPEAVNIEKSATFLSWERADGEHLTMVFGPRTCKEVETLRVEKPAPNFAPVISIELSIFGPKAEVAELKKKINRQAFVALLGPVVK
jgi:hypothetical protein